MRPKSTLQDLPTTRDVGNHLHNEFVKWLARLKDDIEVSTCVQICQKISRLTILQQATPGKISATADMWTVDTTKAAFLGVTAHWIEVKMEPRETWAMRSEVIGFRPVSGDHSGENIGRYFVGVCDRIGIMNGERSKVKNLLIT
jgi:hypothetical protein